MLCFVLITCVLNLLCVWFIPTSSPCIPIPALRAHLKKSIKKNQCCQVHLCGVFIQEHSSTITIFLSLTHSSGFVWLFHMYILHCPSSPWSPCTQLSFLSFVTIVGSQSHTNQEEASSHSHTNQEEASSHRVILTKRRHPLTESY